jgi:hypothetical protein
VDWRLIWHCAASDGVPRRAFRVMIVVGTLLNLINQGGAILGASKIDWVKLVLTFAVPYGVATYGGATARLAALRASAAAGGEAERAR